MTTTEHLNEHVLYGGVPIRRGELIADLQRIAAESGHPNPDALVQSYLRGATSRP